VELLEPLGGDAACTDAARVLRIPGTTNPKAGAIVSVVDGVGTRYGFDAIADAIFRASGRPTRQQMRERKSGYLSPGKERGLHPRDRFASVLRDLESIRVAWGGSIPEGIRNVWLHLAVTSLTFTMTPDEIIPEAMRLAAIATPRLPPSEVRATAKAAVARANAVGGGYLGPGRDPRLSYSGERMAEVLGISQTMAEALGLQQIIPQVLRTERRNTRRREKRHREGGCPEKSIWRATRRRGRNLGWRWGSVARSTTREGRPGCSEDGATAARTGPVPLQGALATPKAPLRAPEITPQKGDPKPRRARREPAEAELNAIVAPRTHFNRREGVGALGQRPEEAPVPGRLERGDGRVGS
jgi:hypothetical protein